MQAITETRPATSSASLTDASAHLTVSETGNGAWRWTRAEFRRMTELGFFDNRDAELVNGELFPMPPPGPIHSGSVNPVADTLRDTFGYGFCIRTEQPLILGDDSEPQPDIAVCVGTCAEYRQRFPVAAEVRLLLEISDSSLEKDRTVKARDYAASQVSEYWILNLRDKCLEVYREPDSAGYRWHRVYAPGESVAPLSAPTGRTVAVSELFGL